MNDRFVRAHDRVCARAPQLEVIEPEVIEPEVIEPTKAGSLPGLPLVWEHDQAVAAEKFRLLIHRLNRARTKKPIRTVLVTSSVPAEGKSTVALNLSGALAHNGSRTLLVDADLRVRKSSNPATRQSVAGLGGLLRGELSFDEALSRIDPHKLYYLAAGECVNNPMPLFESTAFKGLLKRASEAFDWVIIDSPPLNPLADAHSIGSSSDAILLVVRWGFTPRNELERAVAALDGLPLLGIVLNTFDDRQDKSYYSYYKHSGASSAGSSAPALPGPSEH